MWALMVARWGGDRVPPTWQRKEQDVGDHQGLVKIPRIFLALPNPVSLAHVLDKSALYD